MYTTSVLFLVAAVTALARAAIAQPTPAPMRTMLTMPRAMEQRHEQMMKTPADKAYMNAMTRMHEGMMKATITGDTDHDFLVMMIPHHQAAVLMAQDELKYGRNAKVRDLARRIIHAQNAEIKEMERDLGK